MGPQMLQSAAGDGEPTLTVCVRAREWQTREDLSESFPPRALLHLLIMTFSLPGNEELVT